MDFLIYLYDVLFTIRNFVLCKQMLNK